jgi:UDP-N-acetylglucosamine 1-carboxyvinyltransferase
VLLSFIFYGKFMFGAHILVNKSPKINGSVDVSGAKNAVLVIISSLILTKGKSILENIPNSSDVKHMIMLLQDLGADVEFDIRNKRLTVDTSNLNHFEVRPEIMNKMRASILVMGPLLARFNQARVAFPGGCVLGARPIDYHLNGFKKMGIKIEEDGCYISANKSDLDTPTNTRIIFEYPSVGATENLMMLAAMTEGQTTLVNAALEPEVFDLITVLQKMGADIKYGRGSFLYINGVKELKPITHSIIPDRLEAGTFLLAAAITGGQVTVTNAIANHMDTFLEKMREIGHTIKTGVCATPENPSMGITLTATNNPQAIKIKTGPYPSFPTDLQAPTATALCLANGTSLIEETVFENRFAHVQELQKMGAQITLSGNQVLIRGVDNLYGSKLIASDIRASCALVLAGLAAEGQTFVSGLHHWRRGYDKLEVKIRALGGQLEINEQ